MRSDKKSVELSEFFPYFHGQMILIVKRERNILKEQLNLWKNF